MSVFQRVEYPKTRKDLPNEPLLFLGLLNAPLFSQHPAEVSSGPNQTTYGHLRCFVQIVQRLLECLDCFLLFTWFLAEGNAKVKHAENVNLIPTRIAAFIDVNHKFESWNSIGDS